MRRSFIITAIILSSIICICTSAFAAPPQIATGVAWLNFAQTATGNWPEVMTSEYHSTTAALDTAYALEPASSTYTTALAWMSGQAVSPTDYLSRRIIALKRAGQDTSSEVAVLLQYHNPNGDWNNPDGAWGGNSGYLNDILDMLLARKTKRDHLIRA